jgi:hypothetical protein
MAVGLIVVGVVLALLGVRLGLALNRLMRIARAGAAAEVTPLDPGALPASVRDAVASLEAEGFRVEACSRTELPAMPPECTAHLTDSTNVTVVRAMAIEGHDRAGCSVVAVTRYPGGFLATSRVASMSVQDVEVLQTFPDVEPGQMAVRHREAIAALEDLGARPLPLSSDPLGRLRDEWRADARAISNAGLLTRLAWAPRFSSPATRATPVVERADLRAIADRLAVPGAAPT